MPDTVFTVGHSTRTLDELAVLLLETRVFAVADVRTFPRSRRFPHFGADTLAIELPRRGIQYLPFRELGGFRRPQRDSVNLGWKDGGFRGYADFLGTPPFEEALGRLIEAARARPTAVMCSEATPWRCHRQLLADALFVRGWQVVHLLQPGKVEEHRLTPFARVQGTRITYPAA